ncbi:MAG TPA: TadE/TadG family type IV pilus assembly protein [Terracidiphilus sp.]|nr:TadE/TadG family type IV pilus assembly protein [Terracidiphilus sp.]
MIGLRKLDADRDSCGSQSASRAADHQLHHDKQHGHDRVGEEGATLVEIALSSVILLAILFGVIEMSLAFYSYHFISEAAREATRYAIVRGSNSCTSSSNGLTNCDILPTSTGNPIQAYVRGLGYPGINGNQITVTATWWTASFSGTSTVWTSACPGAVDANNYPCNNPGNKVTVVVNYAFPLSIPFWRATTLNVRSTSSGIIMN